MKHHCAASWQGGVTSLWNTERSDGTAERGQPAEAWNLLQGRTFRCQTEPEMEKGPCLFSDDKYGQD